MVLFLSSQTFAAASGAQPIAPRFVLVLTRHGVRSPTHPTELAAYAKQPWPAWEVAPGLLTPRGALLMKQFGQYYRAVYQSAGLFPKTGCPATDSVFFWADLDERTLATGKALIDGMTPGCGISVGHATGKEDTLFDPIPALGKPDSALSLAAARGAIGSDPAGLNTAYRGSFATLDSVLGCATTCKQISQVPTTVEADPDDGTASVNGGLDDAGTAAENFLLEYTDGYPTVGWGRADATRILEMMRLHALKSRIEHETWYNARAEGSNLLYHIAATLDQAATGKKNPQTRSPLSSRFAVIVGHDTSLSLMAGLLRLSWLMQGYQFNDTPPGGALVFEVYQPKTTQPFVRLFFTAQSLDQMRSLNGTHPNRIPVYIPGCPGFDCPVSTFDTIVRNAVDAHFVGAW